MYKGYVNQQELKGLIGAKGGVNPIAVKTGLLDDFASALEIRQRQQFIRRYRWTGLPKGMDATMIERILYYRGRLVAFRHGDTYYTLPFALNGNIDVYGRYQAVTPLTFNGSIITDGDGNKKMGDGDFITGKTFRVSYDIFDIEGKEAVILNDYTQGLSESIEPRHNINYPFIRGLAETLILIRHNLISSARVFTTRVLDEGQKQAVLDEFNNLEQDILEYGKKIFAVTASTELKELFSDKTLETQQYWECFVSQDNLRENLLGIENNGIFKKKERVLKGEQEMEAGSAEQVYGDGLYNRQVFAMIFNTIFGENIWCEESEVVAGEDTDLDGNIDDAEGVKEVTE